MLSVNVLPAVIFKIQYDVIQNDGESLQYTCIVFFISPATFPLHFNLFHLLNKVFIFSFAFVSTYSITERVKLWEFLVNGA